MGSERPMCAMCFAFADEPCRLASEPDRCIRKQAPAPDPVDFETPLGPDEHFVSAHSTLTLREAFTAYGKGEPVRRVRVVPASGPEDDELASALVREIDHYRNLLADAYVTIGCAVASENGLDGSEADAFHAKVRRLWPAAVDHPTVAKWLALPEEGTAASCPAVPDETREAEVFTASAGTCRRCKSRVRMGGPAPDSCTNCAAPAEPQPPCTVPDETREALEEAMRDRIIEKAGLDANDCDVDSADPADHVVGGIDAMRRSLDTSLGLAMDDVARLAAHPPRAGEVTEAARDEFFGYVSAELDRAYAKHGREPWGRHEFFAILKEEVDELWDDIKADAPDDPMYKEMVQVAAMCFRFFETGGCRYRRAALGRPS